jgi:PilZ domain-containing protein
MELRSNPDESHAVGAVVARARRRAYRQKIRTLVQMSLDSSTGGVLRDLSEFGIAIQTVAALAPNQEVRLLFDLPAPRVRVEATGRVAWTDAWGQAGVQFVDLPAGSERLLKEWILGRILCAAYLFAPCELLAVEGDHAEGASELLFSASPRPAIQLAPAPPAPDQLEVARTRPRTRLDQDAHPRSVRLAWCPIPMSVRTLSKLLDGLIQLCAVLLFAVMTMAMSNILPTWPIALALSAGANAIFMTLYRFLFVFWIRSTPGEHLARLACWELDGIHLREEGRSRFR